MSHFPLFALLAPFARPFGTACRVRRVRRVSLPSLLLASLVLLAVFSAGSALATPFDPYGQDWEGLSQFVRMAQGDLGTQRVVVGPPTMHFGQLKREDGIVMVHPDRAIDVDEFAAFMRAGGRLILLDDYGTGDEILTRFGIRRVPLPARPAEMLRNNPSLAIAEPASVHPTVRDVAHVVTNHATGLEHRALSPLLVVHGDGDADVLLAVAGAVGHGRLIAIGDASIPINAMLRYPGNRALSRALVRYAVDDDVWGKREGKLYVLVNGFQTEGAFGDASHTDTAMGEVRRAILEGAETLRREGLPPAGIYVGALSLAIGVVVWTSTRVGRTHKPVAPRFVRPVPTALQGGIAGHAAILGSPNTSRVLAVLELKSALEEQLATRLGLDQVPSRDELVAKARAASLVDEAHARALSRLLDELGRIEDLFAQSAKHKKPFERIHARSRGADRRVIAIATQIRNLIDGLESAHGKIARSP